MRNALKSNITNSITTYSQRADSEFTTSQVMHFHHRLNSSMNHLYSELHYDRNVYCNRTYNKQSSSFSKTIPETSSPLTDCPNNRQWNLPLSTNYDIRLSVQRACIHRSATLIQFAVESHHFDVSPEK